MSAAAEGAFVRDVPAERAFAFVGREMGFSRAELVGRSRRAGLVRSRALFAWALRRQNVSYPRIASALGREKKAAFAFNQIAEDLRKVDPSFSAKCASWAMATAPDGPQTFELIVHFIERELGIGRDGLSGKKHIKAELEARAMFVWAMRRFRKPEHSWARIGATIDHHGNSAANLDDLALRFRRENADFALSCDRLMQFLLDHKESHRG